MAVQCPGGMVGHLILLSTTILIIAVVPSPEGRQIQTGHYQGNFTRSGFEGDDYIVQGFNLQEREEKLLGWRRRLTSPGGPKRLKSYPWVATLAVFPKLVIYKYKPAGIWPKEAFYGDLEEKFVLEYGTCSGVLILPKVVLTNDHCFWMERIQENQYWRHPGKPNKWKLYRKGSPVYVRILN